MRYQIDDGVVGDADGLMVDADVDWGWMGECCWDEGW